MVVHGCSVGVPCAFLLCDVLGNGKSYIAVPAPPAMEEKLVCDVRVTCH